MQAIKGKKTRLEQSVFSSLWKRGYRFRTNVKDLKGKPDIAVKKYKAVIFIDSCFWHGCSMHFRLPEANRNFWGIKIGENILRDDSVTEYYVNRGWNILRVWEHEIKQEPEQALNKLEYFLRSCGFGET